MASPTRRGTTSKKSTPKVHKTERKSTVPAARLYVEDREGKKRGVAINVQETVRRKSSRVPSIAVQLGYGDMDEIPYVTIAMHSPSENSDLVRRGIRAAFIKRLANDLEIDQSTLTDHLGIARSTYTRKLKLDETLSSGDSAIALGVARIIGEVDRILVESGDPEQMGASFHVAEWTGNWLKQPMGALGNRRPLDYLDNAFGQETVLQLIRQMQTGAFA